MPDKQERFATTNRPRLEGFDYTGVFAYHVTLVTRGRKPLLVEDVAEGVAATLESTAAYKLFDVLAHTVMPDHMHALLLARLVDSNLLLFIQRFKQLTSFRYKQRSGESLWQPSFHVLRRSEDLVMAAAYIFANPQRAGLIRPGQRWPHQGGAWQDVEERRS